MASRRIKCTYEECFRHFDTVESMKKHKTKDDAHDYYCKKCDEDCVDDTELMYHKIISPKHICCPVCGQNFKSSSGRDRHVEIVSHNQQRTLRLQPLTKDGQEHIPKQQLSCAGCAEKFESASKLMSHVEHGECEVIKPQHFHRQKAEKQISKDAWTTATDPLAGTTILSANGGHPSLGANLTLLDDERAWVDEDWQGNVRYDPDNEQSMSALGDGISNLNVDQFPALNPQRREVPTQPSPPHEPNRNLLDLNEEPQIRAPYSQLLKNATNIRPPQAYLAHAQSQSTGNLLDSWNDEGDDNDGEHGTSAATWGTRNSRTHPHHTNPNDTSTSVHIPVTSLPGQNVDAHVQTTRQVHLPSYIDISQFYDPIAENYACPGHQCGGRFPTLQAFQQHVLSGVHTGGVVTCPGCYKRFKTTTALVAHCESGSRKCKVRNAVDFDLVIKEITGGMMAVEGCLPDGSVRYVAKQIHEW